MKIRAILGKVVTVLLWAGFFGSCLLPLAMLFYERLATSLGDLLRSLSDALIVHAQTLGVIFTFAGISIFGAILLLLGD